MNLSYIFIARPIMTTLAMFAVFGLGVLGFLNLPISNLPDVDLPVITVRAGLPGASAETIASTVSVPLEKQFMTIPGVSNITSESFLGESRISIEFDVSKDIDAAALDVQAAINRAGEFLPPNMPKPPTFAKVNPSSVPIMYIAITSKTLPKGELYKYAQTYIAQRLSTINNVAQVQTLGPAYAVRIQVDPGLLAAKDLTLNDIQQAIRTASPDLPVGKLDSDYRTSIINVRGKLSNAAEYRPLIIAYQNDAPVRLSDVANVIDGVNDVRTDLTYNTAETTQEGIVLAVQRQPGSNTVAVSNAIRNYLPELAKELPGSISLNVAYDLARFIETSIHDVEVTLILALLLVVLVIFLYLGNLRDTIIPSLAMPLSILATFIFMSWLGYSLDNLSLMALALATGFIVDDAIVVLENIVRHVENGETRLQAALLGSKEISFTILSMTLSLVAVFFPLLFIGGIMGLILQEFAMTLVIVILASGIISITLTPMLCSRFVTSTHNKQSRVARFSNWFNDTLLNRYQSSLAWAIHRKGIILIMGLLSIVFSILLFIALPKELLPDDDIGFVIGFTEADVGTSPQKMFQIHRELIKIIKQSPDIETFVSLAGDRQPRKGIIFIILKPYQQRQPVQDFIQDMYRRLEGVPGVAVNLNNIPLINLSGSGSQGGAYQYSLQSLNTKDLYSSAERFINRLKHLAILQGVRSDVEMNTPQLDIDILRDTAYRLGINAEDIERTLGLAYAGGRVATIQTSTDQYDVILELKPEFQKTAQSLNELYMRSSKNTLVPLNALSQWKEGIGPSQINHIFQIPSVTVYFNLAPGVALGSALEVINQIASEEVPDTVTRGTQGAAKKFEETFFNISILFLVAILVMYVILGILYESFVHPITILSALPPAILGGLLILYLFNFSLSLYAYLGLFLLIGIVKKNGIMMIDYALSFKRTKEESAEKSIFDAALIRFRPIMMTTFAAIAGALPLALGYGAGGEARQPLGLVIIGGLLVSQLITLFLTPVIYIYLEKWNERLTPKSIMEDK